MVFTKENAKSLGKKGGKNNKGVSTVIKELVNRKWCNSTCSIFYDCPFMTISQQPESKKGFGGKCGLKLMPTKIQRRTVDILQRGSEGIINEYKRFVLGTMSLAVEKTDSLKAHAIYVDKLKDLHELIYGKKTKTELSGEVKTGPSVEDFKKAMKEIKE